MKRNTFLAVTLFAALLGASLKTQAQTALFSDDFDSYTPTPVTTPGTVNGYNILLSGTNFTAIFGYDYSGVTFPTNVPVAPHTTNGTTKGLFLTANKGGANPAAGGATGQITGVNLYPSTTFSGDYIMKFDVWMNYNLAANTTEGILSGIDMSGTKTNRPGLIGSDGLMFTMNGDGGSSATSTTLRDYGLFIGSSAAIPTLLLTNAANTAHFGPTPPLGNNFYHGDIGISNVFPQNFFPTVTNLAGAPGFRWTAVEIRQIGGSITWLINSNVFAQYTNQSAFTSGEAMIGYFDFFSGQGTTNNYAIFDNFRVETVPSLVSISATTPSITESGGSNGVFTITRTGDTSSDITVNYTITGTASNGVDYATLPGSVLIPASVSSVTVNVSPIDDLLAESTETVILSIASGSGYVATAPSSATVSIVDTEVPAVSIAVVSPTMYERLSGDYILYRLSRLGDTNAAITVNLTYTGTAVVGVDYSGSASVNMDSGVVTQLFQVNNPVDNNVFSGNKSIICTVATGSGYAPSAPTAATGTLIDDEYDVETNLFSDSLATDTSANWKMTFGSNDGGNDQLVQFNYDVTGDALPPCPNGSNNGLKMTVNKNDGTAGAAGVNLYPIGQNFSGDYALRFNMYLAVGTLSSNTTEFALCGINHTGNGTNWYRGSAINATGNSTGLPFGVDGIYCSIGADGSGSAPGDFAFLTGTNGLTNGPLILKTAASASETNVFKKPPFNGPLAGAPSALASFPTATWVDVEIKQISNIVTLSIDKTALLVYTNTTANKSGDIMLGYTDPYDSIGQNASVYFSNVRVVNLTTATVPPVTPVITSTSGNSSQVVINFTGGTNDFATAFHVQSKITVDGTFADDGTADISRLSDGSFQAILPISAKTSFYRIRR